MKVRQYSKLNRAVDEDRKREQDLAGEDGRHNESILGEERCSFDVSISVQDEHQSFQIEFRL